MVSGHLFPMTPEEVAHWGQWLSGRPKLILDMALLYPVNALLRIKASRHYCQPYSYFEDGTITVSVTCNFQCVAFDRTVFGLKPEDLEPAELPAHGTPVGCPTHGVRRFNSLAVFGLVDDE